MIKTRERFDRIYFSELLREFLEHLAEMNRWFERLFNTIPNVYFSLVQVANLYGTLSSCAS